MVTVVCGLVLKPREVIHSFFCGGFLYGYRCLTGVGCLGCSEMLLSLQNWFWFLKDIGTFFWADTFVME